MLASLADEGDDDLEEISLERFDRLAGPRGLERPADAAARVDCPVVPELLAAAELTTRDFRWACQTSMTSGSSGPSMPS